MSCTCDTLETITHACGSRGTAKDVIQAFVACTGEIDTIPAAANHVISTDITFLEDGHFFEIGIDKVGSSFNFASQGEGLSKEYLNTAVIFINGVAAAVSKVITGMINGTYVFIIKDKNANQWLLGAMGDGCEVAITAQNDRNGYTLTVTWTSTHLPYNYTGEILLEAA